MSTAASNAPREASAGGPSAGRGPGLAQRLAQGPLVCAEGYLFELERRGYLQAGPFVPVVVLDNPDQVTALHEQFVHAGSDVVEALTYYAHRDKLRAVGKDGALEPLNRQALELARGVADRTGTLLAGNVCNTNVYDPADRSTHAAARAMFEEQVGWAAEAGVDYVIGETFRYAEEALVALEVINAAGLPAAITLAIGSTPLTREGWSPGEACGRLAAAGATVVGLNCLRGPETMLPLLDSIVSAVEVPVAALPVPYRTHGPQPTFHALREPDHTSLPSDRPFPTALDPFLCNRYEIAEFARRAADIGVRYLGVCCGAAPHYIRSMAESLGRQPAAGRYSEDMSKHSFFGSDERLSKHNLEYRDRL